MGWDLQDAAIKIVSSSRRSGSKNQNEIRPQKKLYLQIRWKIALLRAVFEGVRRMKLQNFIASFWRSRRDLQDAAIKSVTSSRWTPSKTPLKIAIFRNFAFLNFFSKIPKFCPKKISEIANFTVPDRSDFSVFYYP